MWALNVISTIKRGRARFDYRGSSMKGDGEAKVGVEKEGVMRRGKLAAPGSCRGRQATSSLKPLEKMQLSQHPDLSPVKPTLD